MKIDILDAFRDAGIALVRRYADVVCWPDPEIRNWPECDSSEKIMNWLERNE